MVHLPSPRGLGSCGLVAARRLGVPVLASHHTDVTNRARQRWVREGYARADRPAAPGRPRHAVDAVRHDHTGLLYDPGAPRDLRTSVATLVGSPTTRARLGAAGLEVHHPDWPAAAAELVEVHCAAVLRGDARPRAAWPGAQSGVLSRSRLLLCHLDPP